MHANVTLNTGGPIHCTGTAWLLRPTQGSRDHRLGKCRHGCRKQMKTVPQFLVGSLKPGHSSVDCRMTFVTVRKPHSPFSLTPHSRCCVTLKDLCRPRAILMVLESGFWALAQALRILPHEGLRHPLSITDRPQVVSQ